MIICQMFYRDSSAVPVPLSPSCSILTADPQSPVNIGEIGASHLAQDEVSSVATWASLVHGDGEPRHSSSQETGLAHPVESTVGVTQTGFLCCLYLHLCRCLCTHQCWDGTFTYKAMVDMFTISLNKHLAIYVFLLPYPMVWKADTFQHPWDHLNIYAFPGYALI